ncbi:MAG TPA: site-specific integrase, partial [Terriglobales bacterium]
KVLPEPAATIVATAAFTGASRGELRGMTWANYHDGSLYVESSVWNSHRTDPKTKARKAPIPIIDQLAVILKMHRERMGNPISGPLFPTGKGTPESLNNVVTRQIRPTLNRCAVCGLSKTDHGSGPEHEFQRDASLPQWRGWHAFRRGLATNLKFLGVDDKTIQAILRHSNVAVTQAYYIKTVPQQSIDAMSRFSALLCSKRAQIEAFAASSAVN